MEAARGEINVLIPFMGEGLSLEAGWGRIGWGRGGKVKVGRGGNGREGVVGNMMDSIGVKGRVIQCACQVIFMSVLLVAWISYYKMA